MGYCVGEEAIQVSMGTSSSEVVSSDRGISSTSSSEEEDEKEGEAERGMELVEEEEGEALKREILRPSVWKMEAREGLLGGTGTGGVWGETGLGAGGAYGGGGEAAGSSGTGSRGGGASCCCCCCSDCANKPSF